MLKVAVAPSPPDGISGRGTAFREPRCLRQETELPNTVPTGDRAERLPSRSVGCRSTDEERDGPRTTTDRHRRRRPGRDDARLPVGVERDRRPRPRTSPGLQEGVPRRADAAVGDRRVREGRHLSRPRRARSRVAEHRTSNVRRPDAPRVQIPGPVEVGAIISQPGYLGLLHELCSAFPHYRLDLGTTALEAVRRAGRVVAVKTRHEQAEGDGRRAIFSSSATAGTARCASRAVWRRCVPERRRRAVAPLRLLRRPGRDSEVAERPHARQGSRDGPVAVERQPPSHRVQRARRSGSASQGRARAAACVCCRRSRETLRRLVDAKLDESTESQMLKIIVDRVRSWHAPGILFLGDAAHTMSPSGGQGLNVAIRDTFSSRRTC